MRSPLILALCLILQPALRPPARCDSADSLYDRAMHRVRVLSNSPNVRLLPFGRSPQGRAIPAFVVSDFSTSPNEKTRVLVCAGQHGDEPNPVDALLSLCGRLAAGARPDVLSRCVLIAVPMANPDGIAASYRLTSQGIDANRDWLALTSPETQFVDSLIRTWKPQVMLDLHEWNEAPPVPGDEIEVPPCARGGQRAAMLRFASAMANKSRLDILRCSPRGSGGMFHRRYAARGYAAFLIETPPELDYERKYAAYSSAVLAAVDELTAADALAASPASGSFCLSLVSPYLEPLAERTSPESRAGRMAAVIAVVYVLVMWLARPFTSSSQPAWSRRFRRCSVDASIAADPLTLRHTPRPITLRSWANRRTRSRYAQERVISCQFSVTGFRTDN